VNQTLALELRMSLQVVLNATFDDFLISANLSDPMIANTEVLTDNIGMIYHDYDAVFTGALEAFVYDFNTSHANGWNLKSNQIVGFVAGLIRKTIISPFIQNGYLFAGFRWISDL
jgi:hypothetical protein